MDIEEIKKMNVQDGDVIMFPSEFVNQETFYKICKCFEKTFIGKKFVVVSLKEKAIQGIKVVNIK